MTDAVTVALIAGVPATLAVVLGFINRSKLGAVSVQMDGRLTELLEITRKASHAEGVKDEVARIRLPTSPWMAISAIIFAESTLRMRWNAEHNNSGH